MAKSGWAFASCSICRSYSRIDSFEGGERAHRGTRGRPHGFQARLILGFVRAPVLLEKLAQGGRFGLLQFLQRGPALQKIQRHGGVRILEPLQQLRIIRLEIGSQAIAKMRSFIDQLPAILRQKLQGTGLGCIWIQRPELVPMPDQHVQMQGCVRAIALGSRRPEDFAIVRRAGGMNGEQNQVLVFTQGEPSGPRDCSRAMARQPLGKRRRNWATHSWMASGVCSSSFCSTLLEPSTCRAQTCFLSPQSIPMKAATSAGKRLLYRTYLSFMAYGLPVHGQGLVL